MLFSFTKRDLVAGRSPVLGVGVDGVGVVADPLISEEIKSYVAFI